MPTLAQYKPLSFTMHLFEIAFDEHNKLSNKDYPVFVHEYMHFVQDIAYCSSVMGFLCFIDDVLSFINDLCITDNHVSIIKSANYGKHRNIFMCFDSPENGQLINQIKAITPLQREFTGTILSIGINHNKHIAVGYSEPTEPPIPHHESHPLRKIEQPVTI